VKKVSKSQTLRRIDVEIVRRMIFVLYEKGKQRKTRMALMAHLSYDKCMRYLEWLELMGIVYWENERDFEYVVLTDAGVELYRKYSLHGRSRML
jgi:predicted transcriptional regulator